MGGEQAASANGNAIPKVTFEQELELHGQFLFTGEGDGTALFRYQPFAGCILAA